MLFVRFFIFPLLSIGMKIWGKYETIMLLSKISHENCSDFTLIFSLFWRKKMKSLKNKDFGIIYFFLTSIDMNHGPNFQKKVVSGPESFKKGYFFHKKGIFLIFFKICGTSLHYLLGLVNPLFSSISPHAQSFS